MIAVRVSAPLLIVLVLSGPAAAQTALERFVAAQNPCSKLKTDIDLPIVGKQRIGVNKLRSVAIDEVEIRLQNDRLTATLSGSLACETSDKSVIPASVSVDFDTRADADLASCRLESLTFHDVSFGGSAASAMNALWPVAEDGLKAAARDWFAKECRRLTGG